MEHKNKQEAIKLPASTAIAIRGIHTDSDFAAVFTALVGDTLSGAVTPNVANAACNAAGKVLKMVELRQKYGKQGERLAIVDNEGPKTPAPTRESVLAKLSDAERAALGV